MAAHTILLNDMEMTPLLLPLPSDIYSGREREREEREFLHKEALEGL